MPLFSRATIAGYKPVPAASCRDFRKIFDDHARFVWRSLLGLGVSENDVADASQQVFFVVKEKLDRLVEGCSLRTFVYGICLRVAADFRNRAHVRREHLCAVPPDISVPASQEGILSNREELRRLWQALDQLEPAQREVFVLFEIEEISMAEVAKAMRCPLQTAYSRLYAARKAVAITMGEPSEDL
jgi:RNA polymerase sigma-70 factor, ECF subfamily